MRRATLLATALAALAAPVSAQVAPPLAKGILVEELPFSSRPAPNPAAPTPPSIADAKPPATPAPTVEVAPHTTLTPGFLSTRPVDAPFDGPMGGPRRGIGDQLLEAGPGVVLQRRF
jgi:hypothetical protein